MNDFSDYNNHIYAEMLVHPAIFCHAGIKRVAILSDDPARIVEELLKHSHIQYVQVVCAIFHHDQIENVFPTVQMWMDNNTTNTFDLIICTETEYVPLITTYRYLAPNGIVIQKNNPLSHVSEIKKYYTESRQVGFYDCHLLTIPQYNAANNFISVIICVKQGLLGRVREKDIYNKVFTTYYYNYDIHKAAFVLPEFLRLELEEIV